MKWTRQRCQLAPRTLVMAAFSPSCASEITSFAPRRPRRARLRKNSTQNGSASLWPTVMPSTSRRPSLLTPTATPTPTTPRLSRDPVDDPAERAVVQPHLDQFRPHRVPGGLERYLPPRPAQRTGGGRNDRLGGRDALFVHGRDRSGTDGALCARTGWPTES